MDPESVAIPPRQRLSALKASAEFPAGEFNHSIKTWVNMASLLIKQGSMAESNKDDENAYISFIRSCLIITKIIPCQPNYRAMMNDIVCIDLRQKILLVIARIGHLERRLLKQFEQENLQRLQEQQQQQQQQQQPHVVQSRSLHPTSGISPGVSQSESDSEITVPGQPFLTFHQDGDDDVEEEEVGRGEAYPQRHRKEDEEEEDMTEGEDVVCRLNIAPASTIDPEPALDLNSRNLTAAAQYHRRSFQRRSHDMLSYDQKRTIPMITRPTSPLATFPPTTTTTTYASLKKVSSNEDYRALLTPECQPNNNMNSNNSNINSNSSSNNNNKNNPVFDSSNLDSALASSMTPSQLYASLTSSSGATRHQLLFAEQSRLRAQGQQHIRRCSSTDGIRQRMHFPRDSGTISPAIPPRSEKRSSMMASVTMNGSNGFGSYSNGVTPSQRPALASLRAGDRANRRTMSFEITFTHPLEQQKGLPIAILTSTPRQSVDIPRAMSSMANSVTSDNADSPLSATSTASSTIGSSSSPSTAASTPFASPLLLQTNPQMGQFGSSGKQQQQQQQGFQGYGHGHSSSLTSITSASTSAATMVEGTGPSMTLTTTATSPTTMALAPPSASSCSTHSTLSVTTPTTPVASPTFATASQSCLPSSSCATLSTMSSASTMVNMPTESNIS
ncbi:hypothetical protein BGZ94_003327, partial [Podila epigama]